MSIWLICVLPIVLFALGAGFFVLADQVKTGGTALVVFMTALGMIMLVLAVVAGLFAQQAVEWRWQRFWFENNSKPAVIAQA